MAFNYVLVVRPYLTSQNF